MKAFFYSFFAAVALMLSATSCSQEEMIENGTSGNEVEVSFNVDMEGQQASRAIGDGTTAKYLYFGAYLKEGDAYTYVPTLQPSNWPTEGRMQFVDKKATIKLRLVKGQTYKFVFWAQSEDGKNYYNVNFAENKISAVYNQDNTASANNENRDAFYVAEEFTINGPLTETITLKRPFAQVNVGIKIGELAEAKAAGIDIAKSSFKFSNVPTELNVLTGVAGNEQMVNYYPTLIPEADKTDDQGDLKKVENTDYEYIAMNYIFAGARANVTSTSFTVETDNKVVNTYSVPNLPVQRNYRTNIIASIMGDAEFNIVIDPIFDGDIIYPGNSKEELIFAALNGGSVTLNEDVELDSTLIVADGKSLVINLNGNDIINTSTSTDVEQGDGIIVYGDLVIEGEGTVQAKTRAVWARGNYGAKVTIKGGDFIGADANTEVIYASGDGKIDIYGGTFEAKQQSTSFASPQYAVLNLHGNGKDGCDINVYGGKFKNFDPANNISENPAQSFVAEGYSSKQNGEWFEVVKNDEEDNYPDYVDKGTYYEVYKAAGLLKWAYMVNAGDNDLGLKLMKDIEMPAFEIEADAANETYKVTATPITVDEEGIPSGSNWVPVRNVINAESDGYKGHIDGKGHTIYGLRINQSSKYTGFVGFMFDNGSVKDIVFNDAVIKGGSETGTVAGRAQHGSIVEKIRVLDSKISGSSRVGGVVGFVYRRIKTGVNEDIAIVRNCTINANSEVKGSSGEIGGICGRNEGAAVVYSFNSAKVSGIDNVGGIVGYSRDYWHNVNGYVIACGCTSEAIITATNSCVGGIVGQNLQNINHENSVAYVVGCYSNAQSINGTTKGLIVGKRTYNGQIYGSWAHKIQSMNLCSSTETEYIKGSFALENMENVDEEKINLMNQAITEYNSQSGIDLKCLYKWTLTEGSWPELKLIQE